MPYNAGKTPFFLKLIMVTLWEWSMLDLAHIGTSHGWMLASSLLTTRVWQNATLSLRFNSCNTGIGIGIAPQTRFSRKVLLGVRLSFHLTRKRSSALLEKGVRQQDNPVFYSLRSLFIPELLAVGEHLKPSGVFHRETILTGAGSWVLPKQ